MTLDDYEKALLLIVMYREARGDGMDAMRAVGHVVANRVQEKWGDWIQVMTRPNQFSSLVIIGNSQTVVWPDKIEQSLLDLVEGIYSGSDLDNTNGALYYANEAVATSGWYSSNVIYNPDHPVTVKIGKQTFRR